ncbi:hypothetical protein COCSUDRAFT_32943 [Coccomyxa subellipsoidea C-169]|uniref:Uncharacterized protein n=1 Tax=Coccomyxa subellipsoidea (strain C-169) TaxID=574566 RepID=I0Z060_COCSC|nr:hypothetical protein COCSUDRAFT_32943 [Coccomyxa subellipsoidea C-169]EIE24029.1 hypothetical protein COCSUDRAFT_32943 [Coccomyxa subellipsoidea C-169]|eukprot:XP_005648573.1 hypothetical protein COCSUDRAFT_32943 [Coccomyxa subellipsoidea C-169]
MSSVQKCRDSFLAAIGLELLPLAALLARDCILVIIGLSADQTFGNVPFLYLDLVSVFT